MPNTVPAFAFNDGPHPIAAGGNVTANNPQPGTVGYIRIDNSSPFTIEVSAGITLGSVGAFNSHVFAFPTSAPYVSVTAVGSAVVVFGTDAQVTFTWYDSPPFGQWPSALGAAALSATPTVLLGSFAVNLSGARPQQTFQITSGIQPYHLGLSAVFLPAGIVHPLVIEMFGVLGVGTVQIIQQPTLLAVDSLEIAPFIGAETPEVDILVSRPDGVATVGGQLLIVAYSFLPMTVNVPAQPRAVNPATGFIGAVGSGAIPVAATATVTVKPAAQTGTVHKVKNLSWRLPTAPGAVAAMQWAFAAGAIFRQTEVNAGIAAQFDDGSGCADFWTQDAIQLTNGTAAANASASALWEEWPVSQVPG